MKEISTIIGIILLIGYPVMFWLVLAYTPSSFSLYIFLPWGISSFAIIGFLLIRIKIPPNKMNESVDQKYPDKEVQEGDADEE